MGSTINPLPLPYQEPIIIRRNWRRYPRPQDQDPNEGIINQHFQEYLDQGSVVAAAAVTRLNKLSLTDQSANIGSTDIAPASLPAGLYQVQCFARIVQAANPGPSSLTLTLTYTHRGVSVIENFGAALTANTTQTTRTDLPKMIRIDDATPVLFSATYASVGGVPMLFDVDLVLSRVQA